MQPFRYFSLFLQVALGVIIFTCIFLSNSIDAYTKIVIGSIVILVCFIIETGNIQATIIHDRTLKVLEIGFLSHGDPVQFKTAIKQHLEGETFIAQIGSEGRDLIAALSCQYLTWIVGGYLLSVAISQLISLLIEK